MLLDSLSKGCAEIIKRHGGGLGGQTSLSHSTCTHEERKQWNETERAGGWTQAGQTEGGINNRVYDISKDQRQLAAH